MTLISFAMAARNAEAFIADALDSVPQALQGTGVDYEVVLADGSSSDRTVEIAMTRPFVRLVSDKDAGIYDGMNRAIQAARGEFLLLLNSDDVVIGEGLKAATGRLIEDQTLAMASGAVLAGVSVQAAKVLRHDGALSSAGAVFGVPVINARLFRRDLLVGFGPFKTDIGLGADREFMIRLAGQGVRGAAIDAPIYFYRHHPGSQTMANDREGQSRVYRAEALATAYCSASTGRPALRRLCAAAFAVANLKLRRIGKEPVGPKRGLRSLADSARGLWLWRQWKGRTSGA